MENIIGTSRKLEKLLTDKMIKAAVVSCDCRLEFYVDIMRLKKDENYGIIRYRNSGGNHAYLYIHIKRKIRLG